MLFNNKMLAMMTMLLALSACKDKNAQNQQAAQVPVVEVLQVEPKDVPLSFEFAAKAQGSKETQVRARVGGILLKRNYIEGSQVEEGSVLFEIDPEPFKVTLNQAKAKLAQVRAELKNAETQWKRTEELYKQKYASEKARDEARASLDSLSASVQLAQAEVDAAQLNLDYTTVRAPISGMTSMEAQSEGSLISSTGDSSLLTSITQLDPVYVIFSASENEMMSLTNMVDSGKIRNPDNKSEIIARVKFGNDSLYPLPGKINFINPNVDETTGTIKLRAVFPNPDKRLKPGQFLRLFMEGLVRIDALVVPQEAIMQGANGAYVYRVNDKDVVESVNVQTGLTTGDGGWIIDNGLKPGDKIVISGIMKIRPGMSVNPKIINQANERNTEATE